MRCVLHSPGHFIQLHLHTPAVLTWSYIGLDMVIGLTWSYMDSDEISERKNDPFFTSSLLKSNHHVVGVT